MDIGQDRAGSGGRGGTQGGLAPDTLIATRGGPVPAARLRPGMPILTRDSGYRPLLWAGPGRRCGPADCVAIAPGAFGPGLPEGTLRLAAGHGMLADATPLLATLATVEALVPAAAFGQPLSARPPGGFIQILLDAHELILADGAWVESLGTEAAFDVFPRRALDFADRLLAHAGRPVRPRIDPAALAAPAGAEAGPLPAAPPAAAPDPPRHRRRAAA